MLAVRRGDTLSGMNYLLRSVEVYRTVAQTAEARGSSKLARGASAEADRIEGHAIRLVAEAENARANSASGSPRHMQQLEFIRRLDAERAQHNLAWARDLGHI